METAEPLHRVCGTVEVARDLVHRSQCLYSAAPAPDGEVVESLATAMQALARVLQALEGHLRTPSLGPAA